MVPKRVVPAVKRREAPGPQGPPKRYGLLNEHARGKIKEYAYAVTPPVIARAVKAIRRRFGSPNTRLMRDWEYSAGGWVTAGTGAVDWDNSAVVDAEKAKWPEFVRATTGTGPLVVNHDKPVASTEGAAVWSKKDLSTHNVVMSFAYVLARAAREREPLSMLDWGGTLGHYYLLSRALLPDLDLEYHCYDTPGLCRVGRELLPEGTFHDSQADALSRRYGLIVTSGSLHLSENWADTLGKLAEACDGYLYVARLPFVLTAPSFVVVHYPINYETHHLGWFLNRQEFLDEASRLKLELVREFIFVEQPFVRNAPEQCQFLGFLFRRH